MLNQFSYFSLLLATRQLYSCFLCKSIPAPNATLIVREYDVLRIDILATRLHRRRPASLAITLSRSGSETTMRVLLSMTVRCL